MMHRVLVAVKVVALCGSMLVATGCSMCCRPVTPHEPKVIGEPVVTRAIDGKKMVDEKDMPKIYFDFDKYDIRADQQARAAQCAAFLKGNAAKKIRIEGNCDERGTVEYNLSLGQNRAKVLADYLLGHGVAKDQISILSRGKENPADMGKTEEAYAKNRRDEYFYTAE